MATQEGTFFVIPPTLEENMTLDSALEMVQFIFNFYERYNYQYDLAASVKTLLRSPQNADYLIRALDKCNCCDRHIIDRPMSIGDASWQETIETKYITSLVSDCRCKCRAISRIAFQVFNKNARFITLVLKDITQM